MRRMLTIIISITASLSLAAVPVPAAAAEELSGRVGTVLAEETPVQPAETVPGEEAAGDDPYEMSEDGFPVPGIKLPEPDIVIIPDKTTETLPEGEKKGEDPDTGVEEASAAAYRTSNSYEGMSNLEIMMEVSDRIREALLAGSTTVDLEDCPISTEDKQFIHMQYFCPYFDGVNVSCKLFKYESGGYAYAELTNLLTLDETAAWISVIDGKMNELKAMISDPSYTVEDKALILHDYLASHFYYDTTGYYPAVMLTQGLGVCQSYTYIFQYVMLSQGIECYSPGSDKMGHIWNIIKIGDQYYHIDITWDDPIHERFGQAKHNYFLLSDDTITSKQHYGWDLTEIVCQDTSYEDAYYAGSVTPVIYVGADRYFADTSGLEKYSTASGETTLINSLGKWYYFNGSGVWPGCFSGLGYYDGTLYCNSCNTILSYNPVNGAKTVFASPDTTEGYIYGCLVDGNVLKYSIQTQPNTAYDLQMILALPLPEPHAHVYGDAVVTVEPGCDTPGVRTYTCTICGAGYTEEIPPAHTPGEAVEENEIKSHGVRSWENVVYCEACGTELSREYFEESCNTALSIIVQPEDLPGRAGETVSFAVTAENAAAYQWYYSKDSGVRWYKSTAAGADTNTVSLKITSNNRGNVYRCRVTGIDGEVINSEKAGLLPGLIINKQPQSAEAAVGDTVSFHVDASQVAENGYQWYYSKDSGLSWYKSSANGSNTDTMSITVKTSNISMLYRCKLTGVDNAVLYTDSVGFLVYPHIQRQPAACTAPVGSTASYSVLAVNVASYQWYYSKNNGATWYKSTADGADTAIVSFKATSANRSNLYRCKLTSGAGKVLYTDPAGFAPGLVITAQPVSVNAVWGETVTLSFSAENAAAFQWYYSKDNGVKWYKSSAPGCTTEALTITVNSTTGGNLYKCKVTGEDGTMLYTETAGFIIS